MAETGVDHRVRDDVWPERGNSLRLVVDVVLFDLALRLKSIYFDTREDRPSTMHSTRPCALGAAQRLGAGVSSLRARAPPRVSSFGGRRPPSTEARLRPGRQGVRSDGYDDWYGHGDDARSGGLDAAMDAREDRRWREAYASRVEAKKKRWDAWDALAEEEHARRESAARRRAREKARTSGWTPEKRRLKLDAYRDLSRAADEAYGGKVRRRRDSRERIRSRADPADLKSRDVADRGASAPYARRDANGRETLTTGAALDWLFTPLTRAARGVDEWLNEDIRVTRGRGYAPPSPGERSSLRASARDGRRAFDERRSRDPRDPLRVYASYDGDYGAYADDSPSFGEFGEDSDVGDARRRGSSSSRANARDAFRGLSDRFSNASGDALIDAREFERLRDRR